MNETSTKRSLAGLITVILVIFAALCALYLYTKDQKIWWFKEEGQNNNENNKQQENEESFVVMSGNGDEIIITEPKYLNKVDCPIIISGTAPGSWYFEASFPLELIGPNNETILTQPVSALGDWMTDEDVDFTTTINCTECISGTTYSVILHKDNPSDLEENNDDASFDITIDKVCSENENTTEKLLLKVYFMNNIEDMNVLDCSNVYAVTREVDMTLAVARAALDQLLIGPTEEEISNGYVTQIPEGVELNSITITDGVAYADFSQELQEQVGGSCRTEAIISQIEHTLFQFPTINEVVISIEGESEDILQP